MRECGICSQSWTVFIQVIWGRPGGLFQSSNEDAVKTFSASALSPIHAKCTDKDAALVLPNLGDAVQINAVTQHSKWTEVNNWPELYVTRLHDNKHIVMRQIHLLPKLTSLSTLVPGTFRSLDLLLN